MWGCAGEDKEDLTQQKNPPVGLLLAVTRMMNFPHRLHCLETDGKMEFVDQDVLLLSAHVEGRGKKQEQADQEVKCPRGRDPLSAGLWELCVWHRMPELSAVGSQGGVFIDTCHLLITGFGLGSQAPV